MVVVAWSVLALVFLDELAAMAAFGAWGWTLPLPWLWVWLLPVAAMTVWFLIASPRAPYGGPVRRPVAKVVVFGSASAALWAADRPGWALALLAFSIVVNALALMPFVREVQEAAG